jgi:hypothetical protein
MNVDQVPSRKVNGKLNQKKSKTSSMLGAEQDIEEDYYMYFRADDGTLCRFGTDGLTEKERVTFGFQDTAAENFEDMRRRLGDPEVCSWISYEEYLRKKQTV